MAASIRRVGSPNAPSHALRPSLSTTPFEPMPLGADDQTAHCTLNVTAHTPGSRPSARSVQRRTCWGVHQLPWLSGLPASSCWCWGSWPLTTKMVYPCTAGPVAEHY